MRAAILVAVLVLSSTNRIFAGPAAGYFLYGPATTNTGVAFELTVRVFDALGATATDSAGTVHFTSDGSAVLPVDYTFVPADLGVHVFTVTLHGNAAQTITVTDAGFPSLRGTLRVTVKDPEVVAYLRMDIPAEVTRNAATPVTIRAVNSDQQPVASYRGTVQFFAAVSTELPAPYTFSAADAGTHTFSVVFHRGDARDIAAQDDAGRRAAASVRILCPEITVTAVNDGPLCPGSTATLAAVTNATAPSFVWRLSVTGGGIVYSGPTVKVEYAGLWFVVMTDSDTGCTIVVPTVLERDPEPVISAPAATLNAFTASIENDPRGPYTDIQWTVTSGTILAGQGTLTVTIEPSAPDYGYVGIAVTATRLATGCRLSDTASTRMLPRPFPEAIDTEPEVCPFAQGRTASVAAAGTGVSYAWTIENGTIVSGQGTRAIVFDALASGVMRIGVTMEKDGMTTPLATTVLVGPTAEIATPQPVACHGEPATIPVIFQGTPPFRIVWSDGVEQSEIPSGTASRAVTPAEPTVYSIVRVTDAICEGSGRGEALVDLMTRPRIVRQPAGRRIGPDGTAALSVEAEGKALRFWWYEGSTGNRARLAGGGPSFTTPRLTRTTSYWVEVENDCGVAQSVTAVVTVGGPTRRRGVRH